jgi:hypothetical protein
LFIDIQPAHLQEKLSAKLNAEERDRLRAQIIRECLKLFPNDILVDGRNRARLECRHRIMNNFTPRPTSSGVLSQGGRATLILATSAPNTSFWDSYKLGQGVAVNVFAKMGLDLGTVRIETGWLWPRNQDGQ